MHFTCFHQTWLNIWCHSVALEVIFFLTYWKNHFCGFSSAIPSVCSFRSERPSLTEYLSYNLNFLSVLVGPCNNYKDYIDFIEGRHIRRRLSQHSGTCNGQNGYDKLPDPSPVVRSGLEAVFLYFVYLSLLPPFHYKHLKGSQLCLEVVLKLLCTI